MGEGGVPKMYLCVCGNGGGGVANDFQGECKYSLFSSFSLLRGGGKVGRWRGEAVGATGWNGHLRISLWNKR